MKKYLRIKVLDDSGCYGELIKNDHQEVVLKMYNSDDVLLSEQAIGSTGEVVEYLTFWQEQESAGNVEVEPLLVNDKNHE